MASVARRLSIALVVLGAALRLVQYTAGGGQWLDEVAVSRNILERSSWQLLTEPLAWDQSAPKGFLVVEKVAAALLGNEDWSLRLFPFLGSILALVAFWRLAERVLTGFGPPVAVALLATAGALVTYSGHVKQYSTDVAMCVLILWASVDLVERGATPRRLWTAALAGVLGVWFLQPAVLLLAAVGLVLVVWWWRTADRSPHVWGVLLAWGLSSALATWAGLAAVTPATRRYLHLFWARSFPPDSLAEAAATLWPISSLVRLFGGGGQASQNWLFPFLYVGLMLVGLWSLWRRRRVIGALLLTPILVAVAAAAVRQYPFGDRVLLYLLPVFVLAIAEAVERLRLAAVARAGRWGSLVAPALVAPALAPMAMLPPPYAIEDVRPALAYLQQKRQPGDRVYVYYGAGVGVSYYAERHGLAPSDYELGGCHRGASRRYLEELDAFRSEKRVWFVLTHAIGYNEREDIFGYVNAIAVERKDARFVSPTRTITFPFFPPVEVFLYDFGDPARLAAASASAYKITGPSQAHPAYGCAHGPLSIVKPTIRSGGRAAAY
jgi:hypothetical protein